MMTPTEISRPSEPLLTARGVTVRSPTETLVADIDLDVAAGDSLAIVGESGSGKSLTARAVLGLLPPGLSSSGTARVAGHDLDLADPSALDGYRGQRIGLLMQDPFTMLNPLRRVGAQIADAPRPGGRIGADNVAERLAEVGLGPDVARRFPFELSGGMRQRVGIAAALAGDPEVLVADEPTTALDVTTQRDVLRLIRRLQHERQMGFVMITHDLRVAFSLCDHVTVLYAGRVVERGPADQIRQAPRHPYTRLLVDAEPSLDRRDPLSVTCAGSVPRHDMVAGQCAFAARCRFAAHNCTADRPALVALGPDRSSACVRMPEIASMMSEPGPLAPPHAAASGNADEPVLRVTELTKTFARGHRRALDDVSLTVAPGECVAVVGESGSGKTTLARCIAGLERADGGTVMLGDLDITDVGVLSRAQKRASRRDIAMVFQDPYSSLSPLRRIGKALAEVLAASHMPCGSEDVAALLARVGLSAEYARRLPAQLSGGERQRVSIARAIGTNPRLLVCDEAVSALDVSVQAQVLGLLSRLQAEDGTAMLFITHDLAVVRQAADRVVVMHDGRVTEQGPTDDVLDTPEADYTRRLVASVPRLDPGWLIRDQSSV